MCRLPTPIHRSHYVVPAESQTSGLGVSDICLLLAGTGFRGLAGGASGTPFAVSRRALNNTAGFYTMPAALADDYFDGTSPMTRVKRHFMAARRAGVGYLRCAFAWNGIEPKQGEFRWKFWDNFVSLAEQNHIKIIPYVAYTPQWAARNGKDFWKQPPRKPELYADFMFQIAARYRGRVGAWEIWNEPDNKDYWTGTPDEFAELAMLAAKRIREADPNAVLILGGVVGLAWRWRRRRSQ